MDQGVPPVPVSRGPIFISALPETCCVDSSGQLISLYLTVSPFVMTPPYLSPLAVPQDMHLAFLSLMGCSGMTTAPFV